MIATAIAFLIRLVTGVRIVGLDTTAKTRRIYFANHTSHLDFVVLWAALPKTLRDQTRPVAARDYWQKGAVRRWLAAQVFRAVLIPRNPSEMRVDNPLDIITAALEDGSDLILFPEGTRSETGDTGPFKPGLHHIVTREPDLTLIPVYLENLNRILPKSEFVPVPLMARAVFGSPIENPRNGETREAFLTRARQAVLDLSSIHNESSNPPSHE